MRPSEGRLAAAGTSANNSGTRSMFSIMQAKHKCKEAPRDNMCCCMASRVPMTELMRVLVPGGLLFSVGLKSSGQTREVLQINEFRFIPHLIKLLPFHLAGLTERLKQWLTIRCVKAVL